MLPDFFPVPTNLAATSGIIRDDGLIRSRPVQSSALPICCVLRVHGACFDMYTMSVSVNFHDVCLCLYMMFATVHDFGFCLHPCEILCVPLDSVTQPVLTQFVSMQILSIKKKRNSPCVCTCVSVSLFVSLSVSEFY